MTVDLLLRYLHFVSLILLLAAVLGQHLILRREVTREHIVRAQRLDIVYAVMVVIVLLTGFAQWFWVGKPADFYSSNPVMHIKVTLFLLVGIISIYPSVFLGKNKKGDLSDSVSVPAAVIWSVRIELLILFLMPLLASMMARGIGIPLVSE